jgi:hypothetical protein
MAVNWQQDATWSSRFLPEIKGILGRLLIREAPALEDQQHNTDLIVLSLEGIRVACRIRKFSYLLLYPDEFTIRCSRPGGTQTELAKLIAGWGHYFFYGFANEEETTLAAWMLGDLNVFRSWYSSRLAACRGQPPGSILSNGDNSSLFRAFRLTDLPAPFVLARECYFPDYERPDWDY